MPLLYSFSWGAGDVSLDRSCASIVSSTTGASFTKGLRLRLSQELKSESFVFAKSWT